MEWNLGPIFVLYICLLKRAHCNNHKNQSHNLRKQQWSLISALYSATFTVSLTLFSLLKCTLKRILHLYRIWILQLPCKKKLLHWSGVNVQSRITMRQKPWLPWFSETPKQERKAFWCALATFGTRYTSAKMAISPHKPASSTNELWTRWNDGPFYGTCCVWGILAAEWVQSNSLHLHSTDIIPYHFDTSSTMTAISVSKQPMWYTFLLIHSAIGLLHVHMLHCIVVVLTYQDSPFAPHDSHKYRDGTTVHSNYSLMHSFICLIIRLFGCLLIAWIIEDGQARGTQLC